MFTQISDLNQVLLSSIAIATPDDVRQLVSFSLQQKTILQSLATSKRFDLLPGLLPLIRADDKSSIQELEKMLAQAIADNNKEGIAQIEVCTKQCLSLEKIVFELGKIATPSTDTKGYEKYESYIEGVISVDNLELFLLTDTSECTETFLRGEIVFYSAKRILSHLLDTGCDYHNYIRSSIHSTSRETTTFLFEKVKDRKSLLDTTKRVVMGLASPACRGMIDSEFMRFVTWLLATEFLQLSEQDWREMKELNLVFYQSLQPGV